jgi:hypothetical protein
MHFVTMLKHPSPVDHGNNAARVRKRARENDCRAVKVGSGELWMLRQTV